MLFTRASLLCAESNTSTRYWYTFFASSGWGLSLYFLSNGFTASGQLVAVGFILHFCSVNLTKNLVVKAPAAAPAYILRTGMGLPGNSAAVLAGELPEAKKKSICRPNIK